MFSNVAEEALVELKSQGVRKRDEKLIRKTQSNPVTHLVSPDLEKCLVRSSSFEEDSKLSESSCAVSTTKPTYSEESNHKTSDADSIGNVFENLYKSVF